MILLFFLFNLCLAIPFNDYKLSNNNFDVIMNNNGFQLNNKYNIKYDSIISDNKHKKINFDEFTFNKDYSISTVSTKMDNINFVYEMTSNKTVFLNHIKRVSKYEDDKLYISINLNDWNIKNPDSDLDFKFSIDNSIFTTFDFNNQSISINDEFTIDFDENCIIDGYDERIYLTKSSNKYIIHFPSFQHNLYYQFVISYKNKPNNFNLFIMAILITMGLMYVLLKLNKYYNRRNDWRY